VSCPINRGNRDHYLDCSSLNRRVLFLAQVASESAAVIFDLQTLGRNPALDACLARVLGGASNGSGGGINSSSDSDNGSGGGSCSRISRGSDLSVGRPGPQAAGSSSSCGASRGDTPPAPQQQQPPDAAAAPPADPALSSRQRRAPASRAAAEPSAAAATAIPPPLKCGVGVSEDLRRLARTHPHVRAFLHIPRVLDLRHPWLALQSEKVQLRPPAPVPTLASLLCMEKALHATNSKKLSCSTKLWRRSHRRPPIATHCHRWRRKP